jgi:uncharacterized protein (DUF1778 family)
MITEPQRARLCAYLVRPLWPSLVLFTEAGPTREAKSLMDAGVSSGERTMLMLAAALWTGDGALDIRSLLRLDDRNYDRVVTVLELLRCSGDDLDEALDGIESAGNDL